MADLDAEGAEMTEDVPRAPLWHFASLSFIFFIVTYLHPGGKSIFSFLPLKGSATTVFTLVIGLNVFLTLYAVWGFALAGKHQWLSSGENRFWQPNIEDTLLGVALGIGLMAISIALGLLFPGGQKNIAPGLAKTGFDHALELAMYLVVSICEEIQFRGYFLSQLLAFTRSNGVAIALQAALFVFMHGADQGASGYLTRLAFGVAFGVVAILRKSLWPSMTAHLLINVTAFFVGLS